MITTEFDKAVARILEHEAAWHAVEAKYAGDPDALAVTANLRAQFRALAVAHRYHMSRADLHAALMGLHYSACRYGIGGLREACMQAFAALPDECEFDAAPVGAVLH